MSRPIPSLVIHDHGVRYFVILEYEVLVGFGVQKYKNNPSDYTSGRRNTKWSNKTNQVAHEPNLSYERMLVSASDDVKQRL
ncbi:hypothetical protein J6590_040321 [Homalodisca vitripennis]|nr:hypothetical protein J6590_040321 [Homalodisca vitripennis]